MKEENQRLIKKLNELMRHPLIDNMDEKPIPFLGWYWRDIEPEFGRLYLSWLDGKWWIDEAGKWPYLKGVYDYDEANIVLKYMVNLLESTIKLNEILTQSPRPQETLDDPKHYFIKFILSTKQSEE